MKKALKVLAVVCASVLVTLILLGVGAHLLFFRQLQAENFVVRLFPVDQESLDNHIAWEIERYGEEQTRFSMPSDNAEDYIWLAIHADIRNPGVAAGIDGGMFAWEMDWPNSNSRAGVLCPPNRLGRIENGATEFVGAFSRRESASLGMTGLVYVGDIDDVEEFLRAREFHVTAESLISIRQVPGDVIFFRLERGTTFSLADATFTYEEF